MRASLTTTAGHWQQLDAQRERIAAHRIAASARHGAACAEVAACAESIDSKPLPAGASEGEIAAAADRRAARMGERIAGLSLLLDPAEALAIVNGWLSMMGARAFEPLQRWASRLRGVLARVQAPEWWRRQLRRDVRRRAEAQAIHAGQVNAKAGQWYASDETVRRRLLQNKRNAAILERTELENELGQVFTLKALADKGTGNKAIRRGELMTRIRGCEEWADAEGHVGLFLTLTCPSRFHQQHYAGGLNAAYRGATPRDAQDWLCATWARARAQLARFGVLAYGFRVAEPHHDGCPHWHALVWVHSERDRVILQSVLWAQWLADAGDEPGAAEHRVKCERMRPGGAAGYAAKYIAKNIDDAGAVGREGHDDEWFGVKLNSEAARRTDQGELFRNPAVRVEAWASAWGIRQFQAIGQPPVTVWRELRRVPVETVDDERSPRIAFALDGVNRDDAQRACWWTYLIHQGGTCTGQDYLIKLGVRREVFEGRYETTEKALPIGVYEAGSPASFVESVRRKWKPREGAKGERSGNAPQHSVSGPAPSAAATRGGRSAPPWTRVNNCTQGRAGRWLAGLGVSLASPLEGVRGGLKAWAGGLQTEDPTPWQTPPPSANSSPASRKRPTRQPHMS